MPGIYVIYTWYIPGMAFLYIPCKCQVYPFPVIMKWNMYALVYTRCCLLALLLLHAQQHQFWFILGLKFSKLQWVLRPHYTTHYQLVACNNQQLCCTSASYHSRVSSRRMQTPTWAELLVRLVILLLTATCSFYICRIEQGDWVSWRVVLAGCWSGLH